MTEQTKQSKTENNQGRKQRTLKKILITGASGLLGKALVRIFSENRFFVLAQYHHAPPGSRKNCRWIQADFTDIESLRAFLEKYRADIAGCSYLINNYGPMTSKRIPDLKSEDFQHDFFHNLITAFEITRFFITHSKPESVINIGFENLGKIMPYRKVLTYAVAKNSLLLVTKSFAGHYRDIRFNMVSPVSISGSKSILKKGRTVSSGRVARRIYDIICSEQSGQHIIIE
jgi:NAD(P)-dependent dehydrogenase (short-subunit alcohol dehydrogenase family)